MIQMTAKNIMLRRILIKVNEEIFLTVFKEKKQSIFGNQFTTKIGSCCDYQRKYFLIDFFVSLCN